MDIINYPNPYYHRHYFSYDDLNRLTTDLYHSEEAEYNEASKDLYYYDESSNLTELVHLSRGKYDVDFTMHSKDVYYYENGRKVRNDHFTVNYTMDSLILSYYYMYGYSEEDNWYSETKYDADGTPMKKTEYTHTVFHKPLSIATYNWSEANGVWMNSTFSEFDYYDGVLVEKRISRWSGGTISQQEKQIYTYDGDGNCTQILFQTMVDSVYVDKNRVLYLYDENGLCTNANAERWTDTTWVMGNFPSGTKLFFEDYNECVNQVIGNIGGYCARAEITAYTTVLNPQYIQTPPNLEGEWYYEIQNEDGSTTFQYLEYANDTTVNDRDRVKVIVRTNHIYDKGFQTESTHEYVYEEDGVVYWWNKELQRFTTLFDLNANTGDEWLIEVGYETLVMHVDTVDYCDYNGLNYRTLRVSDSQNLFSGDIVCCFGHLTSFFPERLMNPSSKSEVDGLRCYWVDDALLYHHGEEDCNAVYNFFHDTDETEITEGLSVYPNPTDGLIHIESSQNASLLAYRITNLLGQTLMTGTVTDQLIDVSALPSGMYFITIGNQTVKLLKQ